MGGFTREQALEALAKGWSQESLLELQEQFGNICTVAKVYDWGIVNSYSLVWYQNTNLDVSKFRLRNSGYPTRLVTAYTDGSGTTSEKPAGIGVYVEDGPHRYFIAENIGPGTNNRAELVAIWRVLRHYPQLSKRILIRSDSEYAIGSMTEDWHANANANLIRRMREDLAERQYKVEFEHVHGHSKIEGNEIADRLSGVGRKLVTLVTDYGT